jgi:hypothetical protein
MEKLIIQLASIIVPTIIAAAIIVGTIIAIERIDNYFKIKIWHLTTYSAAREISRNFVDFYNPFITNRPDFYISPDDLVLYLEMYHNHIDKDPCSFDIAYPFVLLTNSNLDFLPTKTIK